MATAASFMASACGMVAPYDAARRETVLGKYRKGELTSSQKDDQATGAISQAVK